MSPAPGFSSDSLSEPSATSNLKHSSSTAQPVAATSESQSQLEGQLTHEKLTRLEKIFEEADEDGGGGLDMDEFRNAMRLTMGDHVTDEELDMLFMKVDTNCDGTVDWDEYLTYMLLECREKDQMQVQARQPFPRYTSVGQGEPRDSLVRIHFLPNMQQIENDGNRITRFDDAQGRYVTVSKEGNVTFWSSDLKCSTTRKIGPVPPHTKSIWITDMVLIPRAHMLAVSTTSRDIIFFETNGNRLERLCHICELNSCPMCMTFWSHPEYPINKDHYLLWGDDNGGICIIIIHECPSKTTLNTRRYKTAKVRFSFADVMQGKVADMTGIHLPNIHNDAVRQVMYSHQLDVIISCCKDAETSMSICDLHRRIMTSYFKVEKGIVVFDFCRKHNVVVTGGYDAVVRVWNPYVTVKPVILLVGHQSPVIHVMVNEPKEHVISIAENKEIRIHDLNTQSCIQTFFRKMLPDLGPRQITAAFFQSITAGYPLWGPRVRQAFLLQPTRQALLFATTTLVMLQHQEKEVMMHSHATQVTCALYNPLFHQVVSASVDSMICVWNVYTGEKEMQFKAHKVRQNGKTLDVEVTAMTFDPTYRRLITGARDGSVKVWNFNNGACLREVSASTTCEVTCIVCPPEKKRILVGGWGKRVAIYMDTTEEYAAAYLQPSHSDDILTMSHYSTNLAATGSHDGDILVWSLDTNRCVFWTNVDGSGRSKSPSVMHRLRRHASSRRPAPPGHSEAACEAEQPADPSEVKTTAVEKVLFLQQRSQHKNTVTLLAGCSDGYVRGYSLHHEGGLRTKIRVTEDGDEPVLCLVASPENELLVTADGAGYIKVWDISHFQLHGVRCSDEADAAREPLWRKFEYYVMQCRRETARQAVNRAKSPRDRSVPTGIHLITSVQSHVLGINCLDFARVNGQDFLLTCSIDCTVRLWTIAGQFLGIFGQPTLWTNIRHLGKQNVLKFNSRWLLPPDVRRVASTTTLRVLNNGRLPHWMVARSILLWLSCTGKTETREEDEKQVPTTDEETVPTEIRDSPIAQGDVGSLLGKSYHKRTRHRPLPKLSMRVSSVNHCAAYGGLPFMEVSSLKVEDVCDTAELSRIQEAYKLPKLQASTTKVRKFPWVVGLLGTLCRQGGRQGVSKEDSSARRPTAVGTALPRLAGKAGGGEAHLRGPAGLGDKGGSPRTKAPRKKSAAATSKTEKLMAIKEV